MPSPMLRKTVRDYVEEVGSLGLMQRRHLLDESWLVCEDCGEMHYAVKFGQCLGCGSRRPENY